MEAIITKNGVEIVENVNNATLQPSRKKIVLNELKKLDRVLSRFDEDTILINNNLSLYPQIVQDRFNQKQVLRAELATL